MVPKIKICGITRHEEVLMLNEAKIEYAGFVIAPSKRQVSVLEAIHLKDGLDQGIQSVAVVVTPDEALLNKIIKGNFDIIQWHGPIDIQVIEKLGKSIWQALSIQDETSFEAMHHHKDIEGYVLDNRQPGSGHVFDWRLLEHQKINGLCILAGGLNSLNVKEGITIVKPHIVDVSSGVEGASGKDRTLIQEFVRKVREE